MRLEWQAKLNPRIVTRMALERYQPWRSTFSGRRRTMQNIQTRAWPCAESSETFGRLECGQRRELVIDRVDHAAPSVIDHEGPFAP